MLVFISDLHLMDGTATVPNLPPGAFRGTLKDIGIHAAKAGARSVQLVLLGDTFDLIWTSKWAACDPTCRPWGGPPSEEGERAASDVLDAVVKYERNAETLAVLSGRDLDGVEWPAEIPLTRVFVPGNHDRLCNVYDSLRAATRDVLGLSPAPPGEKFPSYFTDAAHGVFARHGHEWDVWNFEEPAAFANHRFDATPDDEYLRTPIGDVLTAEVASRLPALVLERLPSSVPQDTRDRLQANLRDIFDVRPLAAILPWLAYRVRSYDSEVQQAINDAVHAVAGQFKQLEFVKEWMKKHDGLSPFDEADKLQMLCLLLATCDFTRFQRVLPVVQEALAWWTGDNHATDAGREFDLIQQRPAWRDRIFYVIYGHTHTPQQRALDAIPGSPEPRSAMYLNTGTWRPGHEKTLNGNAFATWKTLTYTIIYQPGENVSDRRSLDCPTFETWTGGLKDT